MPRQRIVIGVLVLIAVSLIIYYPASRIGFVNNDWIYLDRVARWSLPQYLAYYLLPGAESGWYRPIFGLYFLLIYSFFGPNATAYHWAYILLHTLNALLLWAVISRFVKQQHVWLASLLYVGFPAYSKAVYWPSTPDTIAMMFALLAMLTWVEYLRRQTYKFVILTWVMFLLSLATKETSMTLPIVLFLIDRLLVRQPINWRDMIYRYTPFVLLWFPYLLIEYALQKGGSYVSLAGYGVGSHMFANLLVSLAELSFPVRLEAPLIYIILAIAVIVFVTVLRIRKNATWLFLGSVIIISIAPMLGFPSQWFEMRYLYGSAMAAAVLWAIVLWWLWEKLRSVPGLAFVPVVLVSLILFDHGVNVWIAITDWGEIARQRAVPFRDITRLHPTLSTPAKIYFIDSPTTPLYDLSVMFLLRYGAGIKVDGVDETQLDHLARLNEYPTVLVYYFDETGKPIEVPVASANSVQALPVLPADYGASVRLEGYEATSQQLKRGEPVVLFLYWRALQKVEQDYTVFVHLIDANNRLVATFDAPPRNGKSPTSNWQAGALIVDPLVLHIPRNIVPGANYRLEIGLYSLPGLERLSVTHAVSLLETDHIIIAPFEVY